MELRTTTKPHLAVVGGVTMEMSYAMPRFPSPGETVCAEPSTVIPGGRAISVATSLAALGSRVFFLSCIGLDTAGNRILADLMARRVNVDFVERAEKAATEVSHSFQGPEGNRMRVVSQGASTIMSRTPLFAAKAMISSCQLMVLSPDVPEDTFRFAIEIAHYYRVPVMVLTSPPERVPADTMPLIDVMVANPVEAKALTHIRPAGLDTANESLNSLLKRGVGAAVIYIGSHGAAASRELRHTMFYPAPMTKAQYGADEEDSFAAALAFSLAAGAPLAESVTFANAFAACNETADPAVLAKLSTDDIISGIPIQF